MATIKPTVHVPILHSLVSTLELVTFVHQEPSVLRAPMYLKTVLLERTMTRVGRINASLVHLASSVWDEQSHSSTVVVQVVTTVQSTQLNPSSSHVSLVLTTISQDKRLFHLVCHVLKEATVKAMEILGQQGSVVLVGGVTGVQHLT